MIDDFISYEVLKNVSLSFHGNQKGRHLDFEDDEWEEYVPDMKLQARRTSPPPVYLATSHHPLPSQVSSQPEAQRRLDFLSSVIMPLVDAYWLTATSLLVLPATASQELDGECDCVLVVS